MSRIVALTITGFAADTRAAGLAMPVSAVVALTLLVKLVCDDSDITTSVTVPSLYDLLQQHALRALSNTDVYVN